MLYVVVSPETERLNSSFRFEDIYTSNKIFELLLFCIFVLQGMQNYLLLVGFLFLLQNIFFKIFYGMTRITS